MCFDRICYDLSWKYFDELKFDVILANPPFAGEMKDRKMLAHYALAKPALKRAKNKAAKEERDVLFIERIIKFLKPGGRESLSLKKESHLLLEKAKTRVEQLIEQAAEKP